jgi:asparagine synthase (glutamine-hydrolysing)
MNLRDAAQELLELGPRGAAFRIGWELRGRTGMRAGGREAWPVADSVTDEWTHRLQLEDPISLARVIRPRLSPASLARLRANADNAVVGQILCFGRWRADFGNPIDWHRSPVTGDTWNPTAHWSRALNDRGISDVKVCWEAGRFPHAYVIARAATLFPEQAEIYAAALADHIAGFLAQNPVGYGIHWASGQEVGFRLLAWLFALDVLLMRTGAGKSSENSVAAALMAGARHIEQHLDYARIAVYNNHLLSEALALFAVGALLSDSPEAMRWRRTGRDILDAEAERQFYADGGYIQQSHNYHRVALQDYLWACTFARSIGDRPSDVWLRALGRSLDLLVAHQNPVDGSLPNYGSNDGALPSILSTCDFSDMRPTLQAVSVLVRGERQYEEGPWDEEAAWFLGVRSLDAPIRTPSRTSVSFATTGYHVLRGNDERSFAAFRCGTLHDRFSQIDMLHLDVCWRGHNVLVDAGSYQYNAAPTWHEHFMRTAAHNTVVVDGRDQMLHHRQFKVLYWTKADLLGFRDNAAWAACSGAHYGYKRHPGSCIHRRDILFLKNDTWVVVDRIVGEGVHNVRLHWLGGPFEWVSAPEMNGMDVRTTGGVFQVRTFAVDGSALQGDVTAGDETRPRGWLSRYYGEKVPVPSFAAEQSGKLPQTMISVLSGHPFEIEVEGSQWTVETPVATASFDAELGLLDTAVESVL